MPQTINCLPFPQFNLWIGLRPSFEKLVHWTLSNTLPILKVTASPRGFHTTLCHFPGNWILAVHTKELQSENYMILSKLLTHSSRCCHDQQFFSDINILSCEPKLICHHLRYSRPLDKILQIKIKSLIVSICALGVNFFHIFLVLLSLSSCGVNTTVHKNLVSHLSVRLELWSVINI